MSGCPSFGVAIHERHVSSLANGIAATLEETLILVLAVDDAGGSVFLDERDGKELSFGFGDQGIEFNLHGFGHWFGFYWFGFGCGEKVACHAWRDKKNQRKNEHGGNKGGGDDDDGLHGVVWLRGEIKLFGGVCQRDF